MNIKQTMEKVKASFRESERLLNEASVMTDNTEEQINIANVLKHVQEGIQELTKSFPKATFDKQAWLQRQTTNDTEHNEKIQKILDAAIATGAYDDSESKPTISCHFDYSDDGIEPCWRDE